MALRTRLRVSQRLAHRNETSGPTLRSTRLKKRCQRKNKKDTGIVKSKSKKEVACDFDGETLKISSKDHNVAITLNKDVIIELSPCKSKKMKEKLPSSVDSEPDGVVNTCGKDEKTSKTCSLDDSVTDVPVKRRGSEPYVLLQKIPEQVKDGTCSESNGKVDSETSSILKKQPLIKDTVGVLDETPIPTPELPIKINEDKEVAVLEMKKNSVIVEEETSKNDLDKKLSQYKGTSLYPRRRDNLSGVPQNGAVKIGRQKSHKYFNMLSKRNRLNMYKLNLEKNSNFQRLSKSDDIDVNIKCNSTLPDLKFKRKKKLEQQTCNMVFPSHDTSLMEPVDNQPHPGTSKGINQSSTSSNMSTLPIILRNSVMTQNTDSELDDEDEFSESNTKGKNLTKEIVDVIDGIAFVTFESEHDMVRFTRFTTEESSGKVDCSDLSISSKTLGAIVLRKTKDIRKIKGWQKKKFNVSLNPMNELNSQDIESSDLNDGSTDNIVFEHNYIRRLSTSSESFPVGDYSIPCKKETNTLNVHNTPVALLKEDKLPGIADNSIAIEGGKNLEWKPSAKSAFVSFSSGHSDAQINCMEHVSGSECSSNKIDINESSEQSIVQRQISDNSMNAVDNLKMKLIKLGGRTKIKSSVLKVNKSVQTYISDFDIKTWTKSDRIDDEDNVKYPSYNWCSSFNDKWEIDYERALFAVTAVIEKPLSVKVEQMDSSKKCENSNRSKKSNIQCKRRSSRLTVKKDGPVRNTRSSFCSSLQDFDPYLNLESSSVENLSLSPGSAYFSESCMSVSSHSSFQLLLPPSPSTVDDLPPISSGEPKLSPPCSNSRFPIVGPHVSLGNTPPHSSDESIHTSSKKSIANIPVASSTCPLIPIPREGIQPFPKAMERSPALSSQMLCIPPVKTSSIVAKLSQSVQSTSLSKSHKSKKTGRNLLNRVSWGCGNSKEGKDSENISDDNDNNSSGEIFVKSRNKGETHSLSDAESSGVIWEICDKKKFSVNGMSPDQENEDLRVFLRPKPRKQMDILTQEAIVNDSPVHGISSTEYTSFALNNNSSPAKGNGVEVFKSVSPKSPSAARKKLIRELSKLNANFVSVDENASVQSNESCSKEFCKLGCVCESIRTQKRLIEHCGQVECMFSCTCTTKGNIFHPAKQIIGSDTVSRLQEESSRHMAKVEKAFHNTVVEAAGELVLPGRRQRERRLPKRFLDVSPPEMPKKPKCAGIFHKNGSEKVPITKKDEVKSCSQVPVKQCKIILKKIQGYSSRCLNHRIINCPCIYRKPRGVAVKSTTPRNIAMTSREKYVINFNLAYHSDLLEVKPSDENQSHNTSSGSDSQNPQTQEIVFDSNHNLSLEKEILETENHPAETKEKSWVSEKANLGDIIEKETLASNAVNSMDIEIRPTSSICSQMLKTVTKEKSNDTMEELSLFKGSLDKSPDVGKEFSEHCARTAGIDLWISQYYTDSSTPSQSAKILNKCITKDSTAKEYANDLISQDEETPLFKIVEVKSLPPSSFDSSGCSFEESEINQADGEYNQTYVKPNEADVQVNQNDVRCFPNYESLYSWLYSSETRCKDLEYMCSTSLAPLNFNSVKIIKWSHIARLLKTHSAHMWIRQRLGSSGRIYVTQNDIQPDAACVNFLDLEKKAHLTAKVASILQSAKNDLSNDHGYCILICKRGFWEVAGNINLNEDSRSTTHITGKNIRSHPRIMSFRGSQKKPINTSHPGKVVLLEQTAINKLNPNAKKPPVGDCNLNNLNSDLTLSPEVIEPPGTLKVLCNPRDTDVLDPVQVLEDIETALPGILEEIPLPKDFVRIETKSRSPEKDVINYENMTLPKKMVNLSEPSKETSDKSMVLSISADSVFGRVNEQTTLSDIPVRVENSRRLPLSPFKIVSLPAVSDNQRKTLFGLGKMDNSFSELDGLEGSENNVNLVKDVKQVAQSQVTSANANRNTILPKTVSIEKNVEKNPIQFKLGKFQNISSNATPGVNEKNAGGSSLIPSKEKQIKNLQDVKEVAFTALIPSSNSVSSALQKTDSSGKTQSTLVLSDAPKIAKKVSDPPVLIIDLNSLKQSHSDLSQNKVSSVKIPVRVTNLKTFTKGFDEAKTTKNANSKRSLSPNSVDVNSDASSSETSNVGSFTTDEKTAISRKTNSELHLKSDVKLVAGSEMPNISETASETTSSKLQTENMRSGEQLTDKNMKTSKMPESVTKEKKMISHLETVNDLPPAIKQVPVSENLADIRTAEEHTMKHNTLDMKCNRKTADTLQSEEKSVCSVTETENETGEINASNKNDQSNFNYAENISNNKEQTLRMEESSKKSVEKSPEGVPIVSQKVNKLCPKVGVQESMVVEHDVKIVEKSIINEKANSMEKSPFNENVEVIAKKNVKVIYCNISMSPSAEVNSNKNMEKSIVSEERPELFQQKYREGGKVVCLPLTPSEYLARIASNHSTPLSINRSTLSDAEISLPSSASSGFMAKNEEKQNACESEVIWYRLYLNHDFDRLSVEGTSFNASEKRLISAVTLARNSNKTVRLTFDKNTSSQECQQFKKGIYAVPTAEGMYVKIGPYRKNESTGVMTYKKEGQAYKLTTNLLVLEEPDTSSSEVMLNENNKKSTEGNNLGESNKGHDGNISNKTSAKKQPSEERNACPEAEKVGSELMLKTADCNLPEDGVNDKESDKSKFCNARDGESAKEHNRIESVNSKSENDILAADSTANIANDNAPALQRISDQINVCDFSIEPTILVDRSKPECVVKKGDETGMQNNFSGLVKGPTRMSTAKKENAETTLEAENVTVPNSTIEEISNKSSLIASMRDKEAAVDSSNKEIETENQVEGNSTGKTLRVSLESDQNEDNSELNVLMDDDHLGRILEEETIEKTISSSQGFTNQEEKDVNTSYQDIDKLPGNQESKDFAIQIHDVQGNWSGFTDLPSCNYFEEDPAVMRDNNDGEVSVVSDREFQNSVRVINPVVLNKKTIITDKRKRLSELVDIQNPESFPANLVKELRKKALIDPSNSKPIIVRKGNKIFLVSPVQESNNSTAEEDPKNAPEDIRETTNANINLGKESDNGYLYPNIPMLAPIPVKREMFSHDLRDIIMDDPGKPGMNIKLANDGCVNAYIDYVLRERIHFYPQTLYVKWKFIKGKITKSATGLLEIKDLTKEMFITAKGVFKYSDFNTLSEVNNTIGLDRVQAFKLFEMKRRKETDQAKNELASLFVPQAKLPITSLEKTVKKAILEIKILQSKYEILSQANMIEGKKNVQLEEKFRALIKARGPVPNVEPVKETISDTEINKSRSNFDIPSVRGRPRRRGCRLRGGRGIRGIRKAGNTATIERLDLNDGAYASFISNLKPKKSGRGRPRKRITMGRGEPLNKHLGKISSTVSAPSLFPRSQDEQTKSVFNIDNSVLGHSNDVGPSDDPSEKPVTTNTLSCLPFKTSSQYTEVDNLPDLTKRDLSAVYCDNSVEKDLSVGIPKPDQKQEVTVKENKSIDASLWKESFSKVKIGSSSWSESASSSNSSEGNDSEGMLKARNFKKKSLTSINLISTSLQQLKSQTQNSPKDPSR